MLIESIWINYWINLELDEAFNMQVKLSIHLYICILAGIGLGLLYLPSVVSVTFYFEKRRALATGIAVCGSGVGCFIFAPLGDMLLKHYDWKNGMLFVAGITLQVGFSCVLFSQLVTLRTAIIKITSKAATINGIILSGIGLKLLMTRLFSCF